MHLDKFEFLLGEKKPLLAKINSTLNNDVFSITHATYTLTQKGTLYSQGVCVVDNINKTISMMLEPLNKGVFLIEFTYYIGDGVFKEQTEVVVK